MTRWVIDRIEEGVAVLENTNNLENLLRPLAELPKGVQEGSALVCEAGSFFLDTSDEAVMRSRRIREKFDRLKKS